MLPDGLVITYQVEPFVEVMPELEPCLKAHWSEVADDQDRVPFDPDYAAYHALARAGLLHVVTVRADGDLAGYFISVVRAPLHARTVLCAHVDVYYVKPEYRQGYLPLTLLRKAERFLREAGVQKIFAGHKMAHNLEPLFRRLRWTPSAILYTKWIGS